LSQRGYCSREFQMQRKQTLDIDEFWASKEKTACENFKDNKK
jgi:hypothetical protein